MMDVIIVTIISLLSLAVCFLSKMNMEKADILIKDLKTDNEYWRKRCLEAERENR